MEKTFQKSKPGYRHPDLILPELPGEVDYLWAWYGEIQDGTRLTWAEIAAWSKMMDRELLPDEALIIRKLSFLHFSSLHETDNNQKKK